MKVVKNICFGGFGLSNIAITRLSEITGKSFEQCEREYTFGRIARDDLALVQVVEELGKKANGDFANLAIVEIPDDVDWYIDEYDGRETIEEVHRSW